MPYLRTDRLLTVWLARPAVRLASGGRQTGIPILMYHSVSDTAEVTHPYFRTSTSPRVFREQMAHLQQSGYRTIDLAAAADRLRHETPAEGRVCVLTFDDGYRDFYTHAAPVLQEFGFTATMFLTTSFLGASFHDKACLSWTEVRELSRAGMSFGSHTVSHPQLRDVPRAQVVEELVESKRMIEDKLGMPADTFAYPFAFPQQDTPFKLWLRRQLQSAGYRYGVCTSVGTADRADDLLFLPRLPVNDCDDARFFSAKLERAYDWIAVPQYLRKIIKTRLALGRAIERHAIG